MAPRQHFGTGRLAIDPARAVFINCPFDDAFTPLSEAIVFAVVCCGFIPRSALESGDVAATRMARINQAIFSSKYSIHDLSHCRDEGSEQLARFNLALELGIAMARHIEHARSEDRHDWLVMVPKGHLYQWFLSDLAAWDPKTHDGTCESIVPQVVAWLATRPDAVTTPTPRQVLAALPRFRAAQKRLRKQWGPQVPWADTLVAAMNVAKREGITRGGDKR
jgi:hypothetical protein